MYDVILTVARGRHSNLCSMGSYWSFHCLLYLPGFCTCSGICNSIVETMHRQSLLFCAVTFIQVFSALSFSFERQLISGNVGKLANNLSKLTIGNLMKSPIGNLSKISIGNIVESPIGKWIDTGCNCYKYSCGCCAHLDVPKIHLNDTGCVNFTYLPKDYGISFVVTLDGLTIYNETISAREPPPLCFTAPILEEFADICVHFYDLNATWHMLHGCVKLEARLNHIVLASYKLGCFTIGHNSTLLAADTTYKRSGITYIPKISKYQVDQV